jgi:tRNA pseudouridine55 synthase
VYLVAKPAGPTSHDVVDRARRALGTDRVGHLGTLDPAAEGLLVLVAGRATRLAAFAGAWRKAYEGRAVLGVTTDTDDATGAPIAQSDAWRALDRRTVDAALARFVGGYEQRPPAYSAVKVEGERAYRRARRGDAVPLAPRAVDVHEIALLTFEPPELTFRMLVGAGTYVRSLVRDLGEALGCGAHLARLVRTAVGPFRLADAVAVERLSPADARDPAALVAELPRVNLTEAERAAVAHGRPIAAGGAAAAPGAYLALFAAGSLVAVAERREDAGGSGAVLKPRVVVADA